MNIYLDFDRVLLKDTNTLAPHITPFLQMVSGHPAYWLTSDHENYLKKIVPLLTHNQRNLISVIQPAEWEMLRTEAIDYSQPFLWFTHAVDEFELEDLSVHQCNENLYIVDVLQDPEALRPFSKKLPKPVQPDTTHSPYKHKYSNISA